MLEAQGFVIRDTTDADCAWLALLLQGSAAASELPCGPAVTGVVDAATAVLLGQIILTTLIPHCPVCGCSMSMNLRANVTFVEDAGWHTAAERYGRFLDEHRGQKMLLLELGGGQDPRHHQVPVLAHDEGVAERHICVGEPRRGVRAG